MLLPQEEKSKQQEQTEDNRHPHQPRVHHNPGSGGLIEPLGKRVSRHGPMHLCVAIDNVYLRVNIDTRTRMGRHNKKKWEIDTPVIAREFLYREPSPQAFSTEKGKEREVAGLVRHKEDEEEENPRWSNVVYMKRQQSPTVTISCKVSKPYTYKGRFHPMNRVVCVTV